MSPFAAKYLKVLNPSYEKVQVEFSVKFHAGFDPGYYTKILNTDLQCHLSPWAFAERDLSQIRFGGRLHRSMLLNFVEEQDYVDYVKEFKLHRIDSTDPAASALDVEEALPRSALSIFPVMLIESPLLKVLFRTHEPVTSL